MSDIPDFMRGFDLDDDWGFETVSEKPSSEPTIDPSKIDSTNVEVAKVKQVYVKTAQGVEKASEVYFKKDNTGPTGTVEKIHQTVNNQAVNR